MTVAQLIAALQTMPTYAQVILGDGSYINNATSTTLINVVPDVDDTYADEPVVHLH